MTPSDLATAWRKQAAAYERDGQPGARLLQRCAEELEAATNGDELVSVNDASRMSGYSPDHLGRLIREGRLTNHGTKFRPRLRLADLPRKPQTSNVQAH